ncbi:copper-binding protein [Parvularcula lutaonensis]|uniref:Copper-binding protein n=1 Tax=Parvularcula lutaonensis TaxID=491923 RepID=A0ABV7MBW8_9PROT|nr:copper-binding protein [Parvularcula lutaonensis]GGY48861.1 hypothetical protein GCM10007148_16700 [Parvularcula lutaonensis]
MNRVILTATLSASLVTLSACGERTETAATGDAHKGHDMAMSGDMGHATGTVVSVGDGRLGINHGPIEGVGMGAMTMEFGVMGAVDPSEFDAGDEVAFMVRRGRDGSYRITAICNMGDLGTDCLDGMMDH